MRILILGGTRFLGRYLVESALARGHEVTTFTRGQHDPAAFPMVTNLVGDRDGRLDALRGGRWGAVIDTSGYLPRDVRASAELLAPTVGHYTFVSSISVYANFEKVGMDETTPLATLTEKERQEADGIHLTGAISAVLLGEKYGPLKALCEQTVEEILPGRALIVRPGLIVGPYDYSDRFTYWVRRVADGGYVLAPGRPERLIQWIDVRDLAGWMVALVESRQTGIYNATGPGPEQPLTMGQFLEECRTITGSSARFVWASEDLLLASGVAAWGEMPLWISETSNPEMRGFLTVDCRKAFAAGLSMRPLAETIRDTLAWDRDRPPNVELRAGLAREKELDLLRSVPSFRQ